MNTHSTANSSGTDLPSTGYGQQRVADARRLFQRTLAKWASDVLVIRHRCAHRRIAPDRPAWDEFAPDASAMIHPASYGGGWNQAA